MKVKIFGSDVKTYEETANKWLAENPDIEVKHISTGLNQSSAWILTVIFFEERGEPGQEKPILG